MRPPSGLGWASLGDPTLPMTLPRLTSPRHDGKHARVCWLVGWLVLKLKETGQTGPPYLSLYRLLHGLFAVDVDLLVA